MPHVAHVLRKYDPAEWGGTETHVAAITRALGSCGWTAEVHAPRGPAAADRALAENVGLVRYRSFLPFLGSSARRRALVANAGNIASVDEPLRLAFDRRLALVHLHTAGRIGGAARTAMRLTGRPYVLSIHGPKFAAKSFLQGENERRLSGVIDLGAPIGALLGARRVVEDASRVIVFNDDEHRALASRIGARAVRMDHGVDANRFASGDAARAASKWHELGAAPVVLQVARLCEQKDQLLTVRAFAAGAPAECRLVLAGPETDRGYRARIEAEARSLGVAERVHLLGNVAPEDVPDLLARAAIVVVPSQHEAFGLAVLEGWAAGRAVLFAAEAGLADIARALPDGQATVRSRALDDWAAALRCFLTDPAKCRAAAEEGAALVQRRFRWEAAAQQLAQLYSQVIEEQERARS